MNEIGYGVYLMDDKDIKLMPCTPRTINTDSINGLFHNDVKDSAVKRVISFSRRKGAWVGVAWFQLLSEARRFDRKTFGDFKQTIAGLCNEGLLFVPAKKKGWFSFMRRVQPRIICPTPQLVHKILEHQVQK